MINEIEQSLPSPPASDRDKAIYHERVKNFKKKVLLLHKMIMRLLHKSGLWFTVFEKDNLQPIQRS